EPNMGSLYRSTYRAKDKTLKESAIIWLKYRDALGVLRREASGTDKEQEARRLLKQREGAAVEGRVIMPGVEHVTVAQLAETLKENNARRGFFERAQFEAVRAALPEYARPAATFAYITGWRLKSEILPLQWHRVDFKTGVVTLDVGTTKNRDGRTFPMIPEL